MVTEIWNFRLPSDKLKARKNKFLRPENIEALCVKKCNEEIWSMRSGRMGQFRAPDLKLQGAQGTQIKATLPIVHLVNNFLSAIYRKLSLDTEAAIQDYMEQLVLISAAQSQIDQYRRDQFKVLLPNELESLASYP